MMNKRALILVDLQNDFMPGGALGVKNADRVIPIVDNLLRKEFDLIIASKDWHPPDHVSFAATHSKKAGTQMISNGKHKFCGPYTVFKVLKELNSLPAGVSIKSKKSSTKVQIKRLIATAHFLIMHTKNRLF